MPGSETIMDRTAVSTFGGFAKLSRKSVMGRYDDAYETRYREMMATRPTIAREPWLGMIGPRYKRGGVALIGINGGLGDSQHRLMMSDGPDILLAQATQSLRENPTLKSLNAYFEASIKDVRAWGADSRFFSETICGSLDRLRVQIEDVAYANVIPFRTSDAGALSARKFDVIWEISCREFLNPWLKVISPSLVIWLGKTAFDKSRQYLIDLPVSVVVSRRRDLRLDEKFAELDKYVDALCTQQNER